jgi:methionyl-tRNA synthetase
MAANGKFYVTTAIPYVNAEPYLGHALELVQADVLARHRRLRGQQVRFLTGTDDNALKNVTAARAAGVGVRELVDRNAARFRGLREPRPWELARREKQGDHAAATQLDELLSVLVEASRILAAEVQPFIPLGSSALSRQFHTDDGSIAPPAPVFARLQTPA